MKKIMLKIYIVVFLLLSDFIAFAQPTEDEDGELQGEDEVAVPINGKLIWLFLCGALFAYYKFRQQQQSRSV